MPIEIRPFSPEWLSALREFNGRLEAIGIGLPEDSEAEMLSGSRMYLAVEGRDVRGGYILQPQIFSFGGELRRVAHLRLPLSEGAVNRSYARVASLLLRSAEKTEPLLYALGMGGLDRPLPRMLQAMGWSVTPVPFYFRVVHAARFLRAIRAIRKTRLRAFLMDLAAWTGAGWLLIRNRQRRRAQPVPKGIHAEEAEDFGPWADEIWAAAQPEYAMTAVRDARALQQLYPAGESRFLRLRVNSCGWALLLDTPMQGDPSFGDLRVGTIVDCMASPDSDGPERVIHAARRYLEKRGVDLIVTNQSHAAWRDALRAAGFLQGPPNFLFGASKALAALGAPAEEMHINRGDESGPAHL
ncbi:MAG TPA: hypothetical protein VH640_06325 [Bryobacteraceae bacterium]|jgi:hypothetical protein